jgi:AraC family transcriptional regulator, regulatory protein of adaptative response / DNA-3-methyladenine glycosylase II
MLLDSETCTRALETRDARFDGVFFVGIRTTGIYCRPICPARATLRKNRRYFASAAAAERAGFRPCLRCRPEMAPGLARVDAVPRLVDAAARHIAAGALNSGSVTSLARELGVSSRHLRRAMNDELGISPVELAQTHRLLLAKQLLTDSDLPISRVAYASGFQSVRRFNALFRERYRLAPQNLRGRRPIKEPGNDVSVRLPYRPPLAWDALLKFLAARAVPLVEHVADGAYSRTLAIDGHRGVITCRAGSAKVPTIDLTVSAGLMPVLLAVIARMRELFDLDAEPEKIATHLSSSGLGPIRGNARGLRVPGAADSFELMIRAILGQQVSVKGASTLMTRLTERHAERMETGHPQLTHLAVCADALANDTPRQIATIGMPLARANTIHLVAQAAAAGELRLQPGVDVVSLRRQLVSIPGIGPWTAEYVLMRAVHWPDAFPASDLVLQRAAGLSAAKLTRLSERWRPWRAYAAIHLWNGSPLGMTGRHVRPCSARSASKVGLGDFPAHDST